MSDPSIPADPLTGAEYPPDSPTDREEALRLARAKIVNALNLTPLVPPQADAATMNVVEDAWGALHDYSNIFVALAADLEAAERMFTEAQDVNRDYAGRLEDALHRAEAAERERDEALKAAGLLHPATAGVISDYADTRLAARLHAAERNLATAREALERELRYTHGEDTKRRIRAALGRITEPAPAKVEPYTEQQLDSIRRLRYDR